VNCALSSLYLKVHAFIVMLSLLVKNVTGGGYVSWWRTQLVGIKLVDHSVILSLESKMVPHACRDVSRTLHAYESIWFASYLIMWLVELCKLCDWWIMWIDVMLCTRYNFLVIFVHLWMMSWFFEDDIHMMLVF
jgi:hypothetical protein